jgi:hypothetical protein
MKVNLREGNPAEESMLVNVPKLVIAYYAETRFTLRAFAEPII